MTLNLTWATNALYSSGPDVGTPTKVDPSSAANGFTHGVIAAPQHINFLIAAIEAALAKALDGVDGGSYALSGNLIISGAGAVRLSNVEIPSGGGLHILSGADVECKAGSIISVHIGANVNVQGEINIVDEGQVDVQIGGAINVESGGAINVASGGQVAFASGGVADFNAGSSLGINASATLQLGGQETVLNGGEVHVNSGGAIVAAAGALVTIEDPNDLVINSSVGNFRLTMAPFSIDATSGGDPRWKASALGRWRQTESASVGLYQIAFPLPLPPGDTINSVQVMLDGGPILPTGQMPRLSIVKIDISGTVSTVASTVDTSANAGAYGVQHIVSLVAGTETAGAMPCTLTSEPHYVVLRGEQGGTDDTLELTAVFGQVIARSYRGSGNTMVY